MRQATLLLTVVFSLGMLLTVAGAAEEPVQDRNVLQPGNEVLQCVEPPRAASAETPLAELWQVIGQPGTGSISLCTEEQAAQCPTGCGCLVVNGSPCCVGLASHCALTC